MTLDEPQKLMETLKTLQEKKGFFFNPDTDFALELLAGLIANKSRYGYMSCPCRLATRDRQKDKDIVCPCVFRDEDVKLYGRCYCNLYVSQEVLKGQVKPADQVPERWVRG